MFEQWYWPVLASLVVGNVLGPVVMKRVSGQFDRTRQQVITYSTILSLTVVWFWLAGRGRFDLSRHFLPILLAGLANGLAVYCQWRAVDISLAKSSAFTFLDDAIGIGLAAIFLGEWAELDWLNSLGIGLGILAVGLAARRDWRRRAGAANQPEAKANDPRLYLFVAVFSLIWGGIIVLMRKWGSVDAVPVVTFLLAWYAGSTISAWTLYFLARRRFPRAPESPSVRRLGDALWPVVLAVLVLASTALTYVAYQRAPLVIVQPIFLVAAMVLPTLIGLFFFRERKNLTGIDWFLLALAALGGLVVSLTK